MNNIRFNFFIKSFPLLISLILACFCHLLFSKYGFNPSDNGMFLAYSRRILDGQVPHVDFISIRPALSAIIHIPETYFLEDNLLYLSRLIVLIQFSIISVSWLKIFTKAFEAELSSFQNFFIICISFMLCVHTFPLMSWATIDAIFLISIGFYLSYVLKFKKVGLFLISCSYLCKQSFLFVPFAAIIFSGEYKKPTLFFIASLPGLIYSFIIIFFGGLSDFILQISSGHGLPLCVGINITHLLTFNIWLGFISTLLYFALYKPSFNRNIKITTLHKYLLKLLFLGFLLIIFKYILFGEFFKISQILFGASLSFTSCIALKEGLNEKIGILLTAVLIGWSASLSQGYPQTALFSGVFASMITIFIFVNNENNLRATFVCLLSLVIISSSFFTSRLNEIYREKPSSELSYKLEDNLSGSQNIVTNKNVYDLFGDLNKITNNYDNFKYIIIPDLPFYWAVSPRSNPMSVDWLQNVEVPGEVLQERVLKEIEDYVNDEYLVIVQKFASNNLAFKLEAYKENENYSFAIPYINKNLLQIEETEYFLIYKKK